MTGPKIENSERGITLNKSLAWTMVVGFLTAGLYLGGELQQAHSQQEAVLQKLTAMQVSQAEAERRGETARQILDNRLRVVETTRAADNAEIIGLRRDLSEFRVELREALAALRGREP